jgi:hypothetical protein
MKTKAKGVIKMLSNYKYARNLITILAGVWLLLSPWAMKYQDLSVAAWSAIAVGIVLVLSEVVAYLRPGAWEEILDLVLGIYLVCSPYILGFSSNIKVSDNTAMVGVVVIGLAIVGLLDEPKAQRWWQDHTHHPS